MKLFISFLALFFIVNNLCSQSFFGGVAPASLDKIILDKLPFQVKAGDSVLVFTRIGEKQLIAKYGDLMAKINIERIPQYSAISYQIIIENTGHSKMDNISVTSFKLTMNTNALGLAPRVRYFTGSYHYDACYPSRAFQENERLITTNDHSKPIEIGGENAQEYVPVFQFAVGEDRSHLTGFMLGFEWSAKWKIQAGWENYSFQGEPQSPFKINGEIGSGKYSLDSNEILMLPKVHLIFVENSSWNDLDNRQKEYIREKIAYKVNGKKNINKVTYDHWFGIHNHFDANDMIRQVKRAAELGCEQFCLDASWYGTGAFGSSGLAPWNFPDPEKFPNGKADMQKISALCKQLGMGFGIWHQVETRNGSTPQRDFSRPAECDSIVKEVSKWIDDYDMTWMRWEMTGTGDLKYMNGFYSVFDRLTKKYPNLQIECCLGGGTRFDLGMIRYCTSTWLSDHTGNPEVCRYNQTGALRMWPSYFLNLAIRVHRNSGDSEATIHNALSRMVGTISFNGDIAQWSEKATDDIKKAVEVFKSIRHLQSQAVSFPLPQVRNTDDWDVVVYGNGSGEAQLMYAFRMEGDGEQYIEVPEGKGEWELLLSSEKEVKINKSGKGFKIQMPSHSSALWIRKS